MVAGRLIGPAIQTFDLRKMDSQHSSYILVLIVLKNWGNRSNGNIFRTIYLLIKMYTFSILHFKWNQETAFYSMIGWIPSANKWGPLIGCEIWIIIGQYCIFGLFRGLDLEMIPLFCFLTFHFRTSLPIAANGKLYSQPKSRCWNVKCCSFK